MVEVDKSGINLQTATVVLAGIPFDQNSSFMKGAAMAPARIRQVLQAGATNLCSETGIDLATAEAFLDQGDIIITNAPGWIEEIEDKIFLNHNLVLPTGKAPNYKHQITNKSQIPMFNDQNVR